GEERREAEYGLVWRAAARDPLIAGEREREARAEGRAVHGREDRPGRPRERPCGPRERVELRGEALLVAERDESRKEIRIESSGKGVPQARQDDGRNRRILRERYYRVREHLGHVPREGVPHRRPRELHHRERAFEGDEDERFARVRQASRNASNSAFCFRSATRFSGCHCTAVRKPPPGRSNASTRSSGDAASGTRPGGRSLARWW